MEIGLYKKEQAETPAFIQRRYKYRPHALKLYISRQEEQKKKNQTPLSFKRADELIRMTDKEFDAWVGDTEDECPF